jgi:hypothetical protein
MQRIAAMFLLLIVKWLVGEHLLLKIDNGVEEDERGDEQGIRSMPPSKGEYEYDDVGLRSLFLPTKVKKREGKTPLFKEREGGIEVTHNADRKTVVFLLSKIAQAAFGGFFRPLPCYLYSIEKYWVFDHKFVVFFTTVYRTSVINKPLSPFSRQPF